MQEGEEPHTEPQLVAASQQANGCQNKDAAHLRLRHTKLPQKLFSIPQIQPAEVSVCPCDGFLGRHFLGLLFGGWLVGDLDIGETFPTPCGVCHTVQLKQALALHGCDVGSCRVPWRCSHLHRHAFPPH